MTAGTPVKQGTTIYIRSYVHNIDLEPVTGASDIYISIFRTSDELTYDFNDSTFKAYGSCTTPQQAMSPIDNTNYPGQYRIYWTTPAADEVYEITVNQVPKTTVVNVVQLGEIIVGGWVDDVDAAISSRAAPGDAMDLVIGAVDAEAITPDGAQEIRDQILADSTPFNGASINAILTNTAAIDSRLPVDPADESNQLTAHAQTQADIAALNDLAQSDIQTALANQGYTVLRATNLDSLDQSISSTETAIRGTDSDTLKDLSNQLDAVQADITTILAGTTPTTLADAVWNAIQGDHQLTNSFGDALQRIIALQKENYFIDQMTYNDAGLMTAGRIRLFRTKTDALAATDGGSSENEFASYSFTATSTVSEARRARTARSVRDT